MDGSDVDGTGALHPGIERVSGAWQWFRALGPTLTRRQVRLLAAVALLLTVGPVAISGATHDPPRPSQVTAEPGGNLTFVTTQGTETGLSGGVYAIDPATNEVVWSHTRWGRYFDVDPIGSDQLLLVTTLPEPVDYGGIQWQDFAVRLNWRTGEVVEKIPIPSNTHDVDYLGNSTYVVAEKHYVNSRAAYERWLELSRQRGWIDENRTVTFPRVYVYDAATDDVVWEYDFREHPQLAPPRAGAHLNDVDVVDNGSAVLVSPRNYDTVALIDRETKTIRWTLGSQGVARSASPLFKQHNPVLLSQDPPTVLVADSENDRVVEFRRTATGWEQTWAYHGRLDWPRDADRLPNGNTLVTDSDGDRVVEVSPRGEVVWSYDVRANGLGRKPYDVERLQYGDEPQGPPMHAVLPQAELQRRAVTRHESALAAPLDLWEEYYNLLAWVMPVWIRTTEFLLLHVAAVALLEWTRLEWGWRRG